MSSKCVFRALTAEYRVESAERNTMGGRVEAWGLAAANCVKERGREGE